MKTYRIATIPGDGIGKEVIPAGQQVMEVLESCGALDSSLARAQSEAQAAAAEIATLPDSAAKQWMLELCSYAVKRNV